MIKVDVVKKVRCSADSIKVRKAVVETLEKNGIVSDAEASVAFVGEREIQSLAEKYLGESGDVARMHPVLSFLTGEIPGRFLFPDDGLLHLGEIVISWPWVLNEVGRGGKMVDEVVCEIAKHGAEHLAGRHHE